MCKAFKLGILKALETPKGKERDNGMANPNIEPSDSDFEEYFAVPVPADSDDDDEETEIVFPVVSEAEAAEILAS